MITISKAQLRQVEYLIQQSLQGNHVLFDVASLRAAVGEPGAPHGDSKGRNIAENDEATEALDANSVERHIENLITLPTLAQKRAYLERLGPQEYTALVRSYFNIIENNLLERGQVRH